MQKIIGYAFVMLCSAASAKGEGLVIQVRAPTDVEATNEAPADSTPPGGDSEVEAKFIAMLRNATLKGTWAPVQQGQLGGERRDGGYRIARVEKGEGDKWSIVSVFTVRDRQVEFPIKCSVKFAGDTAVLILDDVKAGRGTANWSARVMFHEDVYIGRWWETSNKEHGGTITGTVTRAE